MPARAGGVGGGAAPASTLQALVNAGQRGRSWQVWDAACPGLEPAAHQQLRNRFGLFFCLVWIFSVGERWEVG